MRTLALLTDIGFASGSNDRSVSILLADAVLILIPHSEITIWTFEGDVVHSLSAHTSFVYSLSILPNGDGASGGEDRTLRIWRGMPPLPVFLGSYIINIPSLLSRRGVLSDHKPSSNLSMVGIRDAQWRHCDQR